MLLMMVKTNALSKIEGIVRTKIQTFPNLLFPNLYDFVSFAEHKSDILKKRRLANNFGPIDFRGMETELLKIDSVFYRRKVHIMGIL